MYCIFKLLEVAGLDYEKEWYKILGQVIYHSRAKQWYLNFTFGIIKNMNKLSFYLRYINTRG